MSESIRHGYSGEDSQYVDIPIDYITESDPEPPGTTIPLSGDDLTYVTIKLIRYGES